ncbi:hypothetical protein [Clostridium botulinum]|uniref:hypothetical protein n=1 Tax=Clostridium botulinum TaxID=1491 RepID=UPI000A46AAA5|nr:hypothetical protein [Clostridium botulinum]MBY6807106.1 hypothetical protein [Clostridium botulinum]
MAKIGDFSRYSNICTINKYHEVFNEKEHKNIYETCRNANIGCAACKKLLVSFKFS